MIAELQQASICTQPHCRRTGGRLGAGECCHMHYYSCDSWQLECAHSQSQNLMFSSCGSLFPVFLSLGVAPC